MAAICHFVKLIGSKICDDVFLIITKTMITKNAGEIQCKKSPLTAPLRAHVSFRPAPLRSHKLTVVAYKHNLTTLLYSNCECYTLSYMFYSY